MTIYQRINIEVEAILLYCKKCTSIKTIKENFSVDQRAQSVNARITSFLLIGMFFENHNNML